MDGDYVIIKHAYVERRLSPLNIYAREANYEAACAAIKASAYAFPTNTTCGNGWRYNREYRVVKIRHVNPSRFPRTSF